MLSRKQVDTTIAAHTSQADCPLPVTSEIAAELDRLFAGRDAVTPDDVAIAIDVVIASTADDGVLMWLHRLANHFRGNDDREAAE